MLSQHGIGLLFLANVLRSPVFGWSFVQSNEVPEQSVQSSVALGEAGPQPALLLHGEGRMQKAEKVTL